MGLCAYCGINAIAENYHSTCEFCIYQCSTCHADTPYEDGVSDSDECGSCDLSFGVVADFNNDQTLPADASQVLEIRTDADMNFTIQGITTGYRNGYAYPETDTTTTTQQGDKQMKNTLYTVVGFDDDTKAYQVVGTTVSDIEPNEMVQLLGKQGETTEFDSVIADFINAEVEQMVALATSKERASASRMHRAEHKQMFMRMGEWNSLIFALEKLREIDCERQDVYVACPTVRVNNGVSVETLINIIKQGLESTQGVVGNA